MKPEQELLNKLAEQQQQEVDKGFHDALIFGTGFFTIDAIGSIRYVTAKEAYELSEKIVNEDT